MDPRKPTPESSAQEEAAADLLEFTLVPRPDRLTALMLAGMDAATREAYQATEAAMATLALGEPAIAPSAGLRDRLLRSVTAKMAHAPRKALVVCDMINDHLVPGRVLEIPRARDIVPALAKRLDDARANGVPVVYVLDRHDPNDADLDVWGQHAIEGSEGAEVWPALAPKPGDRQVTKPSFSGFYQSELEKVLDELGVETIVLTGCATEVQLMATATDALQRGFAVEMPADSQAGASPVAEQVTMGVLSALVPFEPARRARLARLGATPA